MESHRLRPRTLDPPPITDDTITRPAFLTDARSLRQFIKVAAKRAISLERSARAVTAVIEALDLQNLTLVVRDLGGPAGLAGAAPTAERVREIVAVNAFGWRPSGALFRGMLALMGIAPIREFDVLTEFLSRKSSATRRGSAATCPLRARVRNLMTSSSGELCCTRGVQSAGKSYAGRLQSSASLCASVGISRTTTGSEKDTARKQEKAVGYGTSDRILRPAKLQTDGAVAADGSTWKGG